jgi:RHS repeat-associated protein
MPAVIRTAQQGPRPRRNLLLPLAAKNGHADRVTPGTSPAQSTRPASRPPGQKTASGIFLRHGQTRVRRTLRKSLNSRRVAAPAATKSAPGVRYYGQRYYCPSTGRWLSRDASEEAGGANLYGAASNDLIDHFDPLGLSIGSIANSIKNGINSAQKSIQRAFWEAVANDYMRPRNLNMSAELLEHSLQDNPSDLIPYQAAAQPMQNSPEMNQFYQSIPNSCFNDWTQPQNVKFVQNRDLFVAFEDVRVSYKGCKCSGKLDFRVTDRYTFHWQAPEMNQILATVGANGAYISQMLGAIHPFNEEVDFTMPP